MTTAVAEPEIATRRVIDAGDDRQRFVFENVDWDFYEGMLKLLGNRNLFATFDGRRLELMAPPWNHEFWKRKLDHALLGIGEALGIGFLGAGSTTFRRRDLKRGLEPDECYYVGNAPAMFGKREVDLNVDPPPDLAIEIDFMSSSLDRMSIYAALGVPELWRWTIAGIVVHHLDFATREYSVADSSLSFPPLPVSRLFDFVVDVQNLLDLGIMQAARAWAEAGFPPAAGNADAAEL